MVKKTISKKLCIFYDRMCDDSTSMFSKLWVGQDLLAELEAISVLFVFVTTLLKKRQNVLDQLTHL